MRFFFLLICLAITPLQFYAQSPAVHSSDQVCGTEEHHAHLMNTDQAYRARFLEQKAILDSMKYAPNTRDRHLPSVMTIPVVVHVIHLGERVGSGSNIPDQQIYDAITGLNERYANANGQGADIEINFCLANRDPNGCPSSGINRVNGSVVPGYREEGITWDDECGVDEGAIKDLSKWPTWEYYNIWVVHDICGSIAGYAYYPNGGEYDGTVIDITSMTYENGTLAHELGHGLNLQHTFSGEEDDECPENEDCLEDGDEVCDTPPHRRDDCGAVNPCSSEGEWNNSRRNWMSYCFPSRDAGLFTEGQRTRILDAMAVDPRVSLLSSQGCANDEHMKITSDATSMCPYDTRELTAQPEGGYFEIASGEGFINDNILTPTGGNLIVIDYIIALEHCTSSVYQEILVKPVPQSLLRSDKDSLCIGQSTLLHGLPSGGMYSVISGPGIIDSNMLRADGAGVIALAYEKLFSGCFARDSHEVVVLDITEVDIEFLTSDILTAFPDSGSFQWLRCDEGFEEVPDATDAIFQATVSGSYAVVWSNGICSDTSDCFEVVLTGTHSDNTIGALKLYPNPVKDIFYLDGSFENASEDILLTDMRGVLMNPFIQFEDTRVKIDISGLPSGVYMLQVYSEGVGYRVARVVKV